MRVSRHAAVAALGLIAWSSSFGCTSTPNYACTANSECINQGGNQGTCEAQLPGHELCRLGPAL
jgi:hypothetical protein